MQDTLTHEGITIRINPILDLPEHLAEIQEQSIQQVIEDPQRWIDAYYEKIGDKVINSDDAKKLFSHYNDDPLANVQGVHEASSILAKLIFRLRLSNLPAAASILFTAGGAASGKTFASNGYIEGADLVYDSIMKDIAGNQELIDAVIDAGHNLTIMYIYCEVSEAAKSNVERSVKNKRLVPYKVLANGHFFSQQAFIENTNNYANERAVDILYIDNTSRGDSNVINFEEFTKLVYNSLEEVLERARISTYATFEKDKDRYDPRLPEAIEGNFVEPR